MTGFPLDFSFMSFSCLVIFRGCPRHVPFHSFQFPHHDPVIFSVCPLHFPCMSLSFIASHFPTSPFVSSGFLVLCLLCSPPSLPLFSFLSPSCPFQFPFRSLSVPLRFPFISPCFPVMSTSRPPHVLAFPLISSPHFPALPCIFPSLPGIFFKKKKKTHGCFPRFGKKDVKNTEFFQIFGKRGGRKPEPAKSRQSLGTLFLLSEDYTWGTPPPPPPRQNPTCQTSGGGWVKGEVILYPNSILSQVSDTPPQRRRTS